MKLISSLLITLVLAVSVFAQDGSFECRVTEVHQNLQPMAAVLRGTTSIAVAVCATRNRSSECRGNNVPKGCRETVVEIKLDHPNSWPEGKPKVGSKFRARWEGETLQRLSSPQYLTIEGGKPFWTTGDIIHAPNLAAQGQSKTAASVSTGKPQDAEDFQVKELKPDELVRLLDARRQLDVAQASLKQVQRDLEIAYGSTLYRSWTTADFCPQSTAVTLEGKYALIRRERMLCGDVIYGTTNAAPLSRSDRKYAHAPQDKPKAITDAAKPASIPVPSEETAQLKAIQTSLN